MVIDWSNVAQHLIDEADGIRWRDYRLPPTMMDSSPDALAGKKIEAIGNAIT